MPLPVTVAKENEECEKCAKHSENSQRSFSQLVELQYNQAGKREASEEKQQPSGSDVVDSSASHNKCAYLNNSQQLVEALNSIVD